jgi:hypothetical protein
VFATLIIVLVGLAQLGRRMGSAWSRGRSEKEKRSSVPAAVLAVLGLLLGFSFAMAAARYDTRRDLVVQEQILSPRLRAGRISGQSRTPPMSCGCFANMSLCALKRIVRRKSRSSSQPCANAALNFKITCGTKQSPQRQNSQRPSRQVLSPASNETIDLEATGVAASVTVSLERFGYYCYAWPVGACG